MVLCLTEAVSKDYPGQKHNLLCSNVNYSVQTIFTSILRSQAELFRQVIWTITTEGDKPLRCDYDVEVRVVRVSSWHSDESLNASSRLRILSLLTFFFFFSKSRYSNSLKKPWSQWVDWNSNNSVIVSIRNRKI